MPKVLVIDDEVAITTIVSQFLKSDGFETDIAMSGEEGLKKAVTARPDVIVVDIMMPEMDGYEVCKRLRRDPRTARALILALTARGQPIDKQMAFRSGADAHVTKPFKGKTLVQDIQQMLMTRVCMGPPRGYQVLILRLQDKAGATTLATNLALCLNEERGCQAVVADMALQNGVAHEHLGLESTGSWQATSEINPHELATRLLRHESGLFVLPAPTPPRGGQIAPATVTRLLQSLRNWHDYVVLDTSLNPGPLASSLLRSTQLVLLLLTPDPAVLRRAAASMAAIKRSANNSIQIWPILNMMSPDRKPLQEQAEKVWGMPASALLPWSPEECRRAVESQKPVVLGQPESLLAKAIHSLARRIVSATEVQAQEEMPA